VISGSGKDVRQLLVPPALVEPRAVQFILTRVGVKPPPARTAAAAAAAACSGRCEVVR
jgi:hypothetical protein